MAVFLEREISPRLVALREMSRPGGRKGRGRAPPVNRPARASPSEGIWADRRGRDVTPAGDRALRGRKRAALPAVRNPPVTLPSCREFGSND